MENIINAKADTQDKGCYSDKSGKLSCKIRSEFLHSLKVLVLWYTECNQLNVSLMSET
ncbi:Uncharacterised protein [Orientia tsutsugamushi]|uniref:Uncharacterized protein n=1 Tax=Orientia tsutsugamushi TaxID=784 RepID=A0A2R8F0B4_ORITS|nr:hypothetical protein [Orientia tsutsugamushi]SPM44867.1 Uncharacterised protein [Orientia tsutsugamushi]